MKKINSFLLIFGLLFGATACTNWLSEDGAPKMTYDYYGTEQGVDAAVAAAYSFLRWGCGNERYDVLTELGTDLFTAGSDGKNKTSFNAYGTQLNPEDNILSGLWENHYKGISDANIAMDQILQSDMSESKKLTSLGEMLFIRSFLYFELVQQFGKVPLVTEGSFEIRTDFKRAAIADIYKQIITDLRTAVEYLPEKVDDSQKGKATSYAASHLLAKVYLTRGSAVTDVRGQKATDMDSVLYFAENVIKNSPYRLQKNFADLWNIDNMGNSEVIFAVQFTSNPIFNDDGNTFHLYWLRFMMMKTVWSAIYFMAVHTSVIVLLIKFYSNFMIAKTTLVFIKASVGLICQTMQRQFPYGKNLKIKVKSTLLPIRRKDK